MATKTRYIEAVGRRKTATARVRLTPASKTTIVVNDKTLNDYFTVAALSTNVSDALDKSKVEGTFEITALVNGGGISAQADAVRHGIARALVEIDAENKPVLKKLGFLKRDPRSKERRKAGRAGKARKGKQWSKR